MTSFNKSFKLIELVSPSYDYLYNLYSLKPMVGSNIIVQWGSENGPEYYWRNNETNHGFMWKELYVKYYCALV